MSRTHEDLIPVVKCVIEGSDPTPLLTALKEMQREDVYGQAIIRYMMALDKWEFTFGSDYDAAMENLFGHFEERVAVKSEDYIRATHHIILSQYGYDIPAPDYKVAPPSDYPKTEKKDKAPRKAKSKMTPVADEGPIDTDIDLTNASSRLQKVIKIQRGS